MFSSFLLTGSNMGDRAAMLKRARNLLEKHCGKIEKISSIYETAAWGKEDQAAFLNQAIELKTSLEPRKLLREILKIEKKLGRIREEKYGPRVIDIDMLFYENRVMNYPVLILPHPQVQNRRFALTPLAEIAPAFVHPIFKQNINQLLDACSDGLAVVKHPG